MRTSQDGGLGGIGAEAYDDATEVPQGTADRLVPRAVEPVVGEHGALSLARHAHLEIGRINETIAELAHGVTQLNNAVVDLDATANQQRGQIAQLEQVLPQLEPKIAAALNMLTQRIDGLSRQVQGNLRMAALDAAVKGKGPAERNDTILKAAEAYLTFLAPPPPAPPPAAEAEFDPQRTVN
jgi:hypothetical protein